MASFTLIRTDDPYPYRDQIMRLWEENLPGTPRERFDWMQQGNPAGPSVWFLAFEEGGEKVAGTITIMPRRIYHGGREYLSGILGDFMVDAGYRVFGPNRMLMKASLKSIGELGLSFVCTVPNDSSRKIAEHVGVRYITELDCYAKPLNYKFYLEKRFPAPLASLVSLVVGSIFRLFSRETWLSSSRTVEETVDIGEEFDAFWKRLRDNADAITGDRSAAYLRWRYQSNPLYCFRFLTCRKKDGQEISGYAIFCSREENKLAVYDLQAEDGGCFDALVKALTEVGRAEKSQAIYLVAPRWSTGFERLRRFRFIDTKDTLHLGFFGEPDLPLEKWHFMSGDRNI